MRQLEVTIRRFARPFRDTGEIAEGVIAQVSELNDLPEFNLKSFRHVYIPKDFSGLYGNATPDVMTTEFNGKICLVAIEFIYRCETPKDPKEVKLPENSGIVMLSSVESVFVDGEPM